MKASKKLQADFENFKSYFAILCQEHGGRRNEHGELAGPGSAFIVPCADARHGNIHASVHHPWGIDFEIYHNQRSSAAVYLSFHDYAELPDFATDAGGCYPKHWKWNTHTSSAERGKFVECANAALEEFARRLDRACGQVASVPQ